HRFWLCSTFVRGVDSLTRPEFYSMPIVLLPTKNATAMPRSKALVLDRDGTLIRHVHFLADAAAVEILPGVREGLKGVIEAGVLLFLHSNQSGVGRGYFSMEAVEACNRRMIEL